MKGLRNSDWLLQNSHGDVKYGTGNVVNLITTFGVRWVQDLSKPPLAELYELLGWTPETNNVYQL